MEKVNNFFLINCKFVKIYRKLTQADLAAHLGMSRATISGIEYDTVPEIGFRKVISTSAALGLELAILEKSKRPTLQQLLMFA